MPKTTYSAHRTNKGLWMKKNVPSITERLRYASVREKTLGKKAQKWGNLREISPFRVVMHAGASPPQSLASRSLARRSGTLSLATQKGEPVRRLGARSRVSSLHWRRVLTKSPSCLTLP